MHHRPPLPNTTRPIRHPQQLLRYPLTQPNLPSSIRRIQNPLYRRPASLPNAQRYRNRQTLSTARETFLLSDLDERGDRVDEGGKVFDGVEGESGAGNTGWGEAGCVVDGGGRCERGGSGTVALGWVGGLEALG